MSDLARTLYQLAQSGASGRRPRILGAQVVSANQEGGYDITGLNGDYSSVQYRIPAPGLELRPKQRVEVQAISTDHTIIRALD